MKSLKNVLCTTLMILLVLGLVSACSNKEAQGSGTSETTKIEETTTAVPETTPTTTTVEVESGFRSGLDITTVSLMSEEDIENATNYVRYTYSFSDFAANVVFSFSEDIDDFQFVAIEADVAEDGELIINDVAMQLGYGTIQMGTDVIITMDLPEVLPTSGITFTDVDGNAHLLVLLVSGEDGTPYLQEIIAEG
ncbi:MAG: hypothetical protein MJ093_08270 [Saccharofermentans sp.]|nr:hypothetical protein [Saccharofermentans sp.]